ncbi:MAG: ribosomal protein S18-alanine N-acetyltransferase [Nocardioides sp.]
MATIGMTLRAATADDLAPVLVLEQMLFGPDAWSEAQVREELTGERRSAWVATAEAAPDAICGYAVTLAAGDVVDLQRVAVHPGHQRRGLARLLLDAAVEAARRNGAEAMLLEVSAANTAALALYQTAGFEEIDHRRRYYRDGTDAVVMRLPLAAAGRRG